MRDQLLTGEELQQALRRLDKLLGIIYKGGFPRLQEYINSRESEDTSWAYAEDRE